MGTPEVSDRMLWDDVIAGDSDRFGSLYDRHRDRVFGYALRVLRDHSNAEDITAIAFLELWRRRASVRFVDDSLLPWLLVTTSNAARNAQRSTRRYANFLAKLPPPELEPDHAEHSAQSLDAAPARAALSAAISELPAVDQELLALTALEGLTLQQASSALGLSYGAAKTRLSRARRKLRDTVNLTTDPQLEGMAP